MAELTHDGEGESEDVFSSPAEPGLDIKGLVVQVRGVTVCP